MTVVALVQARMGSSRLPGKVLADLAGQPMLFRVVSRLGRSKTIDMTVVATTNTRADDVIAAACDDRGVPCFRGHPTDVLDRFYRAASAYSADTVVRVTADCPFVDTALVDHVVATHETGDFDYVATLHPPVPDGLDVEAFSFALLERAWTEARLPTEREHVTPWLRTNVELRSTRVGLSADLPGDNLRLSVDEPQDLDFARAIYARLANRESFSISDIGALLISEPHLLQINSQIVRNEGYYRSLAQEALMPGRPLPLERSQELYERASRVIPSATQTFSKGASQFVRGAAPIFLARGEGSHVWDVDGNEFIDYPMALGPVILGHADPSVTAAVVEQVQRGTAFSLPHQLEVDVAEQLIELIPCAEMVRFGKNGSDATAGAVRVARAFTGRDVVLCCGYHGWQDWYIGTTTRNRGVPDAVSRLTVPFAYNDLDALAELLYEHRGSVAAIVMEPVGVQAPQEGFLEGVRDLARSEDVLLVFDEIVTGFRLALGGAQELYGVVPDLACFGKAMGNGYPIAAIVGRADVMRLFDEVFFSFTFGGELAALAAARATIGELVERDVIPHLWAQGTTLADGYNVLASEAGLGELTRCEGLPPRTVVTFTEGGGHSPLVLKSLFQQECLKRGVLFSGNQNMCFAHSAADLDHTLRAYRASLEILREALEQDDVLDRLEGAPVEPVFRQP